MERVRVGLIGFGVSGSVFHLPFLLHHPGFEVRGVSTSRAGDVRARGGEGLRVVEEPEALIGDPNIDLIVNTAPNHLHYRLSKEALAAGKHVIVEKPFVTSLAEGTTLIRLAAEKRRALSVFHNRRFDSDFLTLQNIVRDGTLGELAYFASRFDRFRPAPLPERWREQAAWGCGTVFDLGSHLIDQTLQLFGSPQTILADIAEQRRGAQTADYFHILLAYERMKVVLHGSSLALGQEPRFVLHGDRGSYLKYGLDPQEEALKRGGKPSDPGFGCEDPAFAGTLSLARNDGVENVPVLSEIGTYATYYDLIYRALCHGGPLPVPAEEALTTIDLIAKAYVSAEEKRWVSC